MSKLSQLGAALDTAHTVKGRSKSTGVESTAAAVTATSSPQPPSSTLFRPSNMLTEQHGRGNNWAMGYVGRTASEGAAGSLLANTLDAVRREAERMDLFDSIVLMHSLAGGTGSGLGSRITEEIRDEYAKQFILSVCLTPFGTGDTPLQHYNSLLCLSHLYPVVDGIIMASNADVSRALHSQSLKPGPSAVSAAPVMSFAGINTYLSACLADVLAPTKTVPTFREREEAESTRIRGNEGEPVTLRTSAHGVPLLAQTAIHELVNSVVPMPAYKMMEIWSSAGMGQSSSAQRFDPNSPSHPTWQSCMSALKRFVPSDGGARLYDPRAIGYAVYARGDSHLDPVANAAADLTTRFRKLFPHVTWNPYPLDLIATELPRMSWADPRPPSALEAIRQETRVTNSESTRSIAVCVNRSRTPHTLAPVVEKARTLLNNKAYLHWVRGETNDMSMTCTRAPNATDATPCACGSTHTYTYLYVLIHLSLCVSF